MSDVRSTCVVKAVLFDLDDTLVDSRHSRRSGLAAATKKCRCFQQMTLDELERDFAELLDKLQPKLLRGIVSLEESRAECFRQLFSLRSEEVSTRTAIAMAEVYRQTYRAARRPISGALSLLRKLKSKVNIAVVSNNLVAEQREKLQCCGLEPFVDFLVVSEEVGIQKPEAGIFEAALKQVQCTATEAVMVGDSWHADILGAYGVGIRAVWFNRLGVPCPDPTLAIEINSYKPLVAVLDLLLKGLTKP